MAKKSKNAAAAAAEPPAKKSKNAAAAAAAAVKVDGRVFRDAFQVGDEVGVSKFAGRPVLLWRPATIVRIKEKKWPVVYEIKWGTNDRYVAPFRTLGLTNTVCVVCRRPVSC